MRFSYFFLFLLIILGSVSVFAQPPGQILGDLTILYPKYDIVKVNENFTAHFHVYNSLNELLDNTDFDCFVHVYGTNGSHEFQEETLNDPNGIDKEWLYDASAHNDIGWHAYNVFCNTTSENGAVAGSFLVSHSGFDYNDAFKIALIYIIGVSLLMFLLLYVAFKLDERHLVLKFFIISFVIFLASTITKSVYVMNFDDLSINLVKYYMRFLKAFVYYVIIAFCWIIADYYGKTDRIKDWVNRKFRSDKYE